MGRTARNRDVQHPKPVEKIELSEKNIGLRFVLTAILLVVAVVSFGYGVNSLLSIDAGWTEVEVDSSAETNVANEFVFMYNLGTQEDMSITAENKAIIALYTDVMENAYKIFHDNQEFEHVNNIYYINRHPNEEIVVDDMLYNAFSLIKEYENRNIYLGPVYALYDDIFYCENDSQIVDYDPFMNTDVASEYKEMAKFAYHNSFVEVQLLGDNTIKLFVSDEYLQYCEENGITDFIDFSWMKNAFIIDYLAESFIEKGYTSGSISSYDGYMRSLDDSGDSFSLNIFDRVEGNVYQTAIMNYSGAKSIVSMRNFPINTLDEYSYYELENGDIRTMYLDVEDGLCKSATNNLCSYSTDYSCAEIMLQIAPIFISDHIDEDAIKNLKMNGIYSIYMRDKVILYNEENLSLADVYKSDALTYTTMYME